MDEQIHMLNKKYQDASLASQRFIFTDKPSVDQSNYAETEILLICTFQGLTQEGIEIQQ